MLPIVMPILDTLNLDQQRAVIFGEGPLLVLAGAGSGKTRVLVHRAAYLMEKWQVDPSEILMVTFTNKAANEMKQRIGKLLGQKTIPLAGTFHSFCARLLRAEAKVLGIDPNFLIYDEADQKEAVATIISKIGLNEKEIKPSSILGLISSAKQELIGPQEYLQYAKGRFQEIAGQVYLEYQKLLGQVSALDFDDLLLKTIDYFKSSPETLEKYQSRFRYVLVDEYQDTNKAQYTLTKMLCNKWRNLTAVGDASQAIYGWRGADFRNLLNLHTDYPDLTVINLEQNYRSTQNILDTAHYIISHNRSHPILKLWTENEKGEKIGIYEARSELEEASFVAGEIQSVKQTDQRKYSDIAVLYRTNAQSRVIEESLLHAGLPYVLVGGVRFYERKEIKDILSLLRLIANPKDLVSIKRLQKLGKRREQKFWLYRENNDFINLQTLSILDNVFAAIDYLSLLDENDPEDLSRLENIKELRSVAAEFADLNLFLENVSLVQQEYLPIETKSNLPPDAITLMTLHAAKGLEFPIVFIVGMEEGIFPHSRALFDNHELEEERRLFYVGITRAKKKLILTLAAKRLYFGQRTSNVVSRFISDIPEFLIERMSPYYDQSLKNFL
ncbi:MAG: ATP-dependent DNA helicase PcrA [Microgenomates group bacterium GW2011_GWB1_44_8]|nr:MAG: ATP-dependent DNA helicase PcrA [Microgenomates group bacterium GW2011_GWB1_44_8]